MLDQTILKLKNAIKVDISDWKNINLTNCYAYALGIDLDIGYFILDLGDVSNLNYKVRDGYGFEEALLNDALCLDLTIKKVDSNYIIEDDESILISLFSTPTFYVDGAYIKDYHFLRKTKNQNWTHKFGNDILNIDHDKKLITSPQDAVLITNKNVKYIYNASYLLRKKHL